MTDLLISPAEPPTIRAIGRTSSLCEELGADILFHSKAGWVGIQRKELADLIASCHDGRLAKELAQLQDLPIRYLIIEGRGQWTQDGSMLTSYGKWSLQSLWGVMSSVQVAGIHVLTTDSIPRTIQCIDALTKYWDKDSHSGLLTRPMPKSMWGDLTNEDYAIHFLQGFPGIGPGTAKKIYEHCGNKVPLAWEITEEELCKISGVGKVRARQMMAVLESQTQTQTTSTPATSAGKKRSRKSKTPSPDTRPGSVVVTTPASAN